MANETTRVLKDFSNRLMDAVEDEEYAPSLRAHVERILRDELTRINQGIYADKDTDPNGEEQV